MKASAISRHRRGNNRENNRKRRNINLKAKRKMAGNDISEKRRRENKYWRRLIGVGEEEEIISKISGKELWLKIMLAKAASIIGWRRKCRNASTNASVTLNKSGIENGSKITASYDDSDIEKNAQNINSGSRGIMAENGGAQRIARQRHENGGRQPAVAIGNESMVSRRNRKPGWRINESYLLNNENNENKAAMAAESGQLWRSGVAISAKIVKLSLARSGES
jgi:hypothetical protein